MYVCTLYMCVCVCFSHVLLFCTLLQTQKSLSQAEGAAEVLSKQVERAEVETGALLRQSEEARELLQQLLQEKKQNDEQKRLLRERMENAVTAASEQKNITQKLRDELARAQIAEREAKKELERQSQLSSRAPSVIDSSFDDVLSRGSGDDRAGRIDFEHSSFDMNNSSMHDPKPSNPPTDRSFTQSIKDIGADLSDRKIEGAMTNEDIIKEQNEASGETKYDTLTRVRTQN
eukprot:m.153681 g.153681  ORF g.153681 m.153681 type:complete len:232 (-) comp13311_c0_seq13:344-1039(-)